MVDVSNIVSQVYDVFIYIFIAIIVLGLAYFFLYFNTYKIRFRIMQLSKGGRCLVIDDRAKEIRKKDGTRYLKLRKKNIRVPLPPKEALNLTPRGKISIIAYYTLQGEIIYTQASDDAATLDPLTTNDREFYLNELRLAEAEKGKKLSEIVALAVPYIAIIIIFVMVLAFWNDIINPSRDMMNTMNSMMEKQASITGDLKEIILERQQIKASGSTPEPSPPT